MSKKICQTQKFFVSAGNIANSQLSDLAITDKRVFVTGLLEGPTAIQFNGQPVDNFYGSNDIFVASLNHCGTQRFFKTAGGLGDEAGLFVNANDKRVVIGGTIDSGTSATDFNSDLLNLVNGQDIFVAGLNHKGVQKFFKIAGGADRDEISGIRFDDEGNIYVSGAMEGPTAFDFNGNLLNIPNGNLDIFVAKLNKCGDQQFIKVAGGSLFDNSSELNVTNNRIFVSGIVIGTDVTDFNGNTAGALNSTNLFVSSLNKNGDQKFFETMGTENDLFFSGSDNFENNTYVLGYLSGQTATDFNGNTIELPFVFSNFFAKLDKCGNQKFFKSSSNSAASLTFLGDVLSNEFGVFITGIISGPTATDFNGTPLDIPDVQNIFVAGFDHCGNQKFFKTSFSNSEEFGLQLAGNENGIYLVGSFAETETGTDFKGNEIIYNGNTLVAGFTHKGCQKFFVTGGASGVSSISDSNIKVIDNKIFVSGNLEGLIGTEFNGQGTGFQGDMFVARLDDLCLPTPATTPFRSKIPVF